MGSGAVRYKEASDRTRVILTDSFYIGGFPSGRTHRISRFFYENGTSSNTSVAGGGLVSLPAGM
jgi:hypothetical protein